VSCSVADPSPTHLKRTSRLIRPSSKRKSPSSSQVPEGRATQKDQAARDRISHERLARVARLAIPELTLRSPQLAVSSFQGIALPLGAPALASSHPGEPPPTCDGRAARPSRGVATEPT
jgi:hypothetical protein